MDTQHLSSTALKTIPVSQYHLMLVFLLLMGAAHAQTMTDSIAPKDTVHNAVLLDVGKVQVVDSGLSFRTDTVIANDSSSSLVKVKKHSVKRAVWFSAVLPGLGQAYNRKYWKIPIIYAGFAGLGYAIYYTATNYNEARTAYRAAVRQQPGSYNGYTDAATIKAYRDYFQGYLNIASICTFIWYGLNLVDAAVDAHLFHYNMDDKLSLDIDPSFHIHNDIGLNQSCLGLSFRITSLGGKQGRRGLY